jgi:cell filamentation protein
VADALAVVHVELVLIHPFREGNGRTARLLAVVMGLQAGLPALFFENLRAETEAVFCCRAGRSRSELRADGADVQRRDLEDFTDSRL